MKLTRWTALVLSAMAGGVPGCGETELEPAPLTITQRDFEGVDADARLTLDTRFDSFEIQQTDGEIDFSRILLICPDGNPMDMYEWLENAGDQAGAMLSDLDGFFLGQTVPPPPPCGTPEECACQQCDLCPDGLWVCYNTCGEQWDQAQQGWRDSQIDPRLLEPPPPPPEDPNDPGDPPPDGSGTGGSGGDGSGGDGSGGGSGGDGSGGYGGSGGSSGSSGSSGGYGGGGYGGGSAGGTTNPAP